MDLNKLVNVLGSKKFDGTGFHRFEKEIKELAIILKIDEFLEETVTPPEQPSQPEPSTPQSPEERQTAEKLMADYQKALRQHIANQTQAKLLIKGNCDDQRKEMIEDCETPFQMISRLRDAYSSKSIQNRLRLEQKFRSFKMSDDRPFRESLNELNFILGELKDVGITKEDEERVNALLSGLPESLRDHAVVWRNDDTITYQKLCDKIINAEFLKNPNREVHGLLSRTRHNNRFKTKAKNMMLQ